MIPSTALKALLLSASLSGIAAFVPHGTAPVAFRPATTASPLETTSTSLAAQRRGRPRGPLRTIEIKPTMNDEIQFDSLRVSVPNFTSNKSGKIEKDEVLGIMSKADALAKAKELGGLDVILINETSDPPVVKIVDYSKYRYEKEKKAKDQKKNSKASEVKEVKMSYKIDVHDYGVRIKNATKFIKQGNRVKCTVQFKGREVQHEKLGFQLLDRMQDDMTQICTMEGKPKREGRNMSCILSPRPEVTKAVNDAKRAIEKEKKRNKRAGKEARANKDGSDAFKDDNKSKNNKRNDPDDDDDDNDSLDELLGSDTTTESLFN